MLKTPHCVSAPQLTLFAQNVIPWVVIEVQYDLTAVTNRKISNL